MTVIGFKEKLLQDFDWQRAMDALLLYLGKIPIDLGFHKRWQVNCHVMTYVSSLLNCFVIELETSANGVVHAMHAIYSIVTLFSYHGKCVALRFENALIGYFDVYQKWMNNVCKNMFHHFVDTKYAVFNVIYSLLLWHLAFIYYSTICECIKK